MNMMKQVFQVQKVIKSEATMRSTLMKMKARLQAELDNLDEAAKIEYTGWYVLLKRDGDKFEVLGLFNPDEFDEERDTEPEWDFAVPIPNPDTYPEFQGW